MEALGWATTASALPWVGKLEAGEESAQFGSVMRMREATGLRERGGSIFLGECEKRGPRCVVEGVRAMVNVELELSATVNLDAGEQVKMLAACWWCF